MGNLSKPMTVRVLVDDQLELDRLSDETGIKRSKLVRLAVKIGLPDLRKDLTRLARNTDKR